MFRVVVLPYFTFSHFNIAETMGFLKRKYKINTLLILVMSAFNYTASVTFSYAASALGPEAGGTVGYAIFNAMSVLTATVAGLIVGEWRKLLQRQKNSYISD